MFDGPIGLGVMTRPGRELSIIHRPQFSAQRLLGDTDSEVVPKPLAQIDQPPPHHPVDSGDRAALDHRRQSGAVAVVQSRWLAGRLAVYQPVRPVGVELHYPIANDLHGDATGLGCLRPWRAFVNRRQRQQTTSLRRVLALARESPQALRVKVAPQRDRHGKPPWFATLNQTAAASRNTPESGSKRFGIIRFWRYPTSLKSYLTSAQRAWKQEPSTRGWLKIVIFAE